jgi:hypothetical protein
MRTLIEDHPENEAYQAWAAACGARTGKMWIARAAGGRCCGCRLRYIQFGSWNRWFTVTQGDTGFAAAPAAMASHGTLKELRVNQGLPDDFDLPGVNLEAVRRAIGNGAPLPMGSLLAAAVAETSRIAARSVTDSVVDASRTPPAGRALHRDSNLGRSVNALCRVAGSPRRPRWRRGSRWGTSGCVVSRAANPGWPPRVREVHVCPSQTC